MSMLQVLLQQSWPQDKPIAEIAFPQILPNSLGNLVTLWVMIPPQEIQYCLFSKPHRQFLSIESPYHPMLLWVTALQTAERGYRWLTCYLDLKQPKNREIVLHLARMGYYRLLLFSTEQPQRCAQVFTVTLSSEQCQRLQAWAKSAPASQPLAQSGVSQSLLKIEFEKIKSHHASSEPLILPLKP